MTIVATKMKNFVISRLYFPKCCIGFSYGLSFPLTLTVLDFWLKDSGVSNTMIGMFSILHWPFTFKFMWGIFIENCDIPYLTKRIGRNRSWIIVSHLILIIGIIGMMYSDPNSCLPQLIFFASLTALGDGCKDVVLYPYQIDGVTNDQLGYVASLVGVSHRIGMIITKVSTLHLAYFFSWRIAYLTAAFSIFLLMTIILFIKQPDEQVNIVNKNTPTLSLSDFIKKSLIVPLKKMLDKNEDVFHVLMLYKSADFMMKKMSTPFFMEIGFSKTEIANIVQLFGAVSVIIGGLAGGYFIKKIKISGAMIYFGICHAISFSFYLILTKVGVVPQVLQFIVFCENFTSGCVTTAFVTFIYANCKTGSIYALLWAIHEMSGIFFMSISGIVVDSIGWTWYFTLIPLAYAVILITLNTHNFFVEHHKRSES